MKLCQCPVERFRESIPFNDAVKFYLRVLPSQKVTKHKVYLAFCPWCDDPRMKVNPMKKVMYCAECDGGGDILTVVAKCEEETVSQAMERLADKYDIVMEMHCSNECRGSGSAG